MEGRTDERFRCLAPRRRASSSRSGLSLLQDHRLARAPDVVVLGRETLSRRRGCRRARSATCSRSTSHRTYKLRPQVQSQRKFGTEESRGRRLTEALRCTLLDGRSISPSRPGTLTWRHAAGSPRSLSHFPRAAYFTAFAAATICGRNSSALACASASGRPLATPGRR